MPKPQFNPKPSEPIDKKEKKENDKIKESKKLENVEISAKGTITAGTWVAEMDASNIRKNTLRK